MNQRQQCLHLAAATVFTLLCAAPAAAQNYPAKVLRYLVNDGAGSGGDIVGRVVAAGLSEQFGQQVIVDNRPGAGGRIGAEIVAKGPADGYTLLHMRDRKSTRLNSSHTDISRMPSSA